MPHFISDSELEKAGGNVFFIVERADAHIHDLLQQLETHKARADAASITAEQNCSIIEQKFFSLSSQVRQLENEKTQLDIALERRSAELAQAQTQAHKLELECMKKDSDNERFSCELNEVRKAKRELLEVVEQKNAELHEKNASIKTYLDKIVFLTDERSNLEGRLREIEAEMVRSQAIQARLSQEKELFEQHNTWLNEELTEKVNTLLEERRMTVELEMELRSKLSEAERLVKETGESFQRSKERVKDLESKLSQTREELRFTKEDAATKEDHLSLEVSTASRLAELYKQSSEEWSKKATDLEGVIKALEAHLNQVETDAREKIEKEVQARESSEKEAAEAKEKLEKTVIELESCKTDKEPDPLLMIRRFSDAPARESYPDDEQLFLELHGEGPIVPAVPSGISGTALAASLLRDGWSLTRIYIKYQEAIDAWRHERQERKHSQALLQRVLYEIEQRADVIMDERAEHARMAEAYSVMEEKLHLSISEQSSLDNSIRELKAELRKKKRDLNGAHKEISDLQTQVTVLLKECTDIQQRFGVEGKPSLNGGFLLEFVESAPETTASDAVISDRLLTFKDIHGMVENNSQLRALVRSLGHQNEQRERELKETFDLELKKRTDEATRKVATILKKSEEQIELTESLKGTVGMYKRLYEEEVKSHNVFQNTTRAIIPAADNSGNDMRRFIEGSQEEVEKVRREAFERLRSVEEELSKTKQEANITRLERDRLIVEATYAREQLQTIVKESENQRKEMDAVLARNVEFSQTITDYQRRLRENAQSVQKAEETSRRLSIEVSVLEREKELISSAEKRASQEVASLSDRVHRLQASLDNIQTAEEARESIRSGEKKKLEDEANRMQKEWAEMKHELSLERAHIRHLTNERDQAVKQAMERVEIISKELADALQQVSQAETRALVAEARCTELDASLKKADEKIVAALAGGKTGQPNKDLGLEPDVEALSLLQQAREDIERLEEELCASKDHLEQYKRLAQMNEDALVQMENAHNRFKTEAEKTKESLEFELSSLRDRQMDLEKQVAEREKTVAAIEVQREMSLSIAEKEIAALRESEASKQALIEQAEERITALKNDVEKQHQQWRTAQNNYERQVLLQADTIRELTTVSESLASFEKEALEMRTKAETVGSELNSSKVAWEMEKEALVSEKEDLSNRFKELDEQNRILLDRVEAMHIVMAENERKVGEPVGGSGQMENDLQNVIRYLRRSKETADTEISLLKQERLRLQKQMESALHAAEGAQANLRREHENVRASLCSDEEFKSLQAQVRELNLLRESNAQLREENKRNFEDCKELREKTQMAHAELEFSRRSLREKEVELEASAKDLEVQKAEISRWQNRVSQLLEKYKAVDVEEYQRTKTEVAETQEILKLKEAELEAAKGENHKLQEKILKLEQEASSKDEKIAELDKKIQESLQSEATCKAEAEKFRKQALFLKRKIESLTKEKDDAVKEKEVCVKQIEELKGNPGKRGAGETLRSEAQIRQEIAAQHEQALKETENILKEKESRIQSLERTLEREREDLKKEREELRKEKAKRQKDQKAFIDLAQKQAQEKQKLQEEMSILRREKDSYAENMQARKTGRKLIRPKIEPAGQLETQAEPSETVMDMAVEGSEAEAEIQDEIKTVATAESICTTSAIVLSASYTASLPEISVPSQSSGPAASFSLAGVRKRASSCALDLVEELFSEQDVKNEAAPLHKKHRGVELKQVMVESESALATIADSVITTEAGKELDMEAEHVAASDGEALDRVEPRTNASIDNRHVLELIDNQKESGGSGPSEAPALKRPRIMRSGALLTLNQPQAVGHKDDKAVDESQEDKTIVIQVEKSSEKKLPDDLDERPLGGIRADPPQQEFPGLDAGRSADETLAPSGEQDPESFFQLLGVPLVEEASVRPGTPETALVLDTERAANKLVAELSNATAVSGAPGDIPISNNSSGLEDAIVTSADDKAVEMASIPEGITAADMVDNGGDVEDGEIEPDGTENDNVETMMQPNPLEAEEENMLQDEAGRNSGIVSIDASEVQARQLDETQVGEKLESLSSDPPQKIEEAARLEGATPEQKVENAVALHKENLSAQVINLSAQVTTRQAAKNTTIHLAERARERALIRKSGMSPPSPGARGRGRALRGTKKSVGVQRGRTAPPDAQAQGTGGEEANPTQTATGGSAAQQSGSQSAPTSNKFDILRDEKD